MQVFANSYAPIQLLPTPHEAMRRGSPRLAAVLPSGALVVFTYHPALLFVKFIVLLSLSVKAVYVCYFYVAI